MALNETNIELPDLLPDLPDCTQLTRCSINTILTKSGRLEDFKRNRSNSSSRQPKSSTAASVWRS